MVSGGYRAPARPAAVSGPGAAARRTDGGPGQKLQQLGDADYGEQKTFRELQQGAPVDQAGKGQAVAASPIEAADTSNVVGFDAPSQRPNEPITAGADSGAGPSSSVLGLNSAANDYSKSMLTALEILANMPFSTPQMRNFVRLMRSTGG